MKPEKQKDQTECRFKFSALSTDLETAQKKTILSALCQYFHRDRNAVCGLPTYCNTIYCVTHLCHGCLKRGLIDEVSHVYDEIDIGLCKNCLDWELNASSIDIFYGNCLLKLSKICPECKCNLSMPHMKIEHYALSTITRQQKQTARRLCMATHIWANIRSADPCNCTDNTCYVSTLTSLFQDETFEKWFKCDKETVFKKICNQLKKL